MKIKAILPLFFGAIIIIVGCAGSSFANPCGTITIPKEAKFIPKPGNTVKSVTVVGDSMQIEVCSDTLAQPSPSAIEAEKQRKLEEQQRRSQSRQENRIEAADRKMLGRYN